jgi:hypothetical protein
MGFESRAARQSIARLSFANSSLCLGFGLVTVAPFIGAGGIREISFNSELSSRFRW